MTTAVDTNILVALWDRDDALNSAAQSALDSALEHGSLAVSAPVFAELMACPGRDDRFLDAFFKDTGITIEWNLDETIWRAAGRAFQAYADRRRKQGQSGSEPAPLWRQPGPRRILADFLIGAHALQKSYRLLTLDDRFYRDAFPGLKIVRV